MIRLILGILLIMLVAGLIGVDACTCGYGPTIRSNIKSLFQDKKPEPMKENRNELQK